MNQIIYLLILFSLLYLIETKAINILLAFVAIIISLAFILPTITSNVENIESEYYSYILILVQVSALTILFGFIIMLFPNLSYSTPKNILNPKKLEKIDNNNYLSPMREISPLPPVGNYNWQKKYIFISILSIIIFFFFFGTTLISYITPYFNLLAQFKFLTSQHTEISTTLVDNFYSTQDTINNLNNSDTLFLRKLGLNLYTIDHNIIKLLVLTIILLLAIISLFFLITL